MANLTPNQITLLQILAKGEHSWIDLTVDQQIELSSVLRPENSFTSDQRELLKDWYLLISPEQLLEANDTLQPLGLAIGSRQTIDGQTVTNADLLTDCIQPTDTYHSIAHILATLKLIKLTPDMFPLVEDLTTT